MKPIGQILVATDFGEASTRAIEVATEITSTFGAKLTVLHTIEELSSGFPCNLPPEIRQAATVRLNETVNRVRRHLSAVEGMLREGLAWNEITAAATEIGADLVVVGSQGPRAGYRYALGSVAEKVVRVCTVPVLTVHPWRFEDRTQAGRELAELVLQSSEQSPLVVALSRRGAMVAAEVAEAFGVSPQLLLDEREGGKDGLHQVDAGRGLGALLNEGRGLGHPWTDDRRAKTILLVDDAILTPAYVLATVHALRRMGTHRLIAATPVASVTAQGALKAAVDAFLVLQVIEDAVPIETLYRDRSTPSDQAVAKRFAIATQWAHAVERRS